MKKSCQQAVSRLSCNDSEEDKVQNFWAKRKKSSTLQNNKTTHQDTQQNIQLNFKQSAELMALKHIYTEGRPPWYDSSGMCFVPLARPTSSAS